MEAKVRPYEEEPEAEDDGADSKRLSELRSELAKRARKKQSEFDAVNDYISKTFLDKQEEAITEFITIVKSFETIKQKIAKRDSLMAEFYELGYANDMIDDSIKINPNYNKNLNTIQAYIKKQSKYPVTAPSAVDEVWQEDYVNMLGNPIFKEKQQAFDECNEYIRLHYFNLNYKDIERRLTEIEKKIAERNALITELKAITTTTGINYRDKISKGDLQELNNIISTIKSQRLETKLPTKTIDTIGGRSFSGGRKSKSKKRKTKSKKRSKSKRTIKHK